MATELFAVLLCMSVLFRIKNVVKIDWSYDIADMW